MEKDYEDLFVAIWSNAILDDYADAVKSLSGYAFDVAYEGYNLDAIEPLSPKSTEFKKIKIAIRTHSKELCERLRPRIKELVYAESRDWPNNSYINKDLEYRRIFNQLKKEALAFAKNKIFKVTGVGANTLRSASRGDVKYLENTTRYKPKEFAELLDISVKTLQRWDRKGFLTAKRTATNRRYYTYDQFVEFRQGDKVDV
jgi:DNA-binding transcriptional regulator YiaG